MEIYMNEKMFVGYADLYDEKMFIDTNEGVGVDRVLKKIDPLICKMASSTYIDGFSFQDIKQELSVIAIDGIRAYDPSKKVKMSTFLHIHLRNKLISKLRSENKMSNDAFAFQDGGSDRGKRVRGEVNFSQISKNINSDSDSEFDFESTIDSDGGLYGTRANSHDRVEFLTSLNKLSESLDNKTSKIIELICLKDYSIKDAASEVGLSGWAASMRLKNLSKNRIVRDLFEKRKCKN
jgi:RNA polymerase sigma factor (sigma-70 family)